MLWSRWASGILEGAVHGLLSTPAGTLATAALLRFNGLCCDNLIVACVPVQYHTANLISASFVGRLQTR